MAKRTTTEAQAETTEQAAVVHTDADGNTIEVPYTGNPLTGGVPVEAVPTGKASGRPKG